MKRATQIGRWLNQVKGDRGLSASAIAAAIQYSERTNAAVFDKFGILLTWQGVPLLAAETGMHERTVQRATRRLQKRGHIAVKWGGGRYRPNRITLILKTPAEIPAETPAALPPFSHQNPGSGDGVSDQEAETPATVAQNPGRSVAKPRQPCHPNLVKNRFRTSATISETDAGAPRSRADALGAPPETGKRLGNGSEPTAQGEPLKPPEPPDPLATLDAELRQRLGDNATWLDAARPVELVNGVLTMAVLNAYQGDNIRKHCQAVILAATGAAEIKFVVADPPKARGRS